MWKSYQKHNTCGSHTNTCKNHTQTIHKPYKNHTIIHTTNAEIIHTPYAHRTQTIQIAYTNHTKTIQKPYTNRTTTMQQTSIHKPYHNCGNHTRTIQQTYTHHIQNHTTSNIQIVENMQKPYKINAKNNRIHKIMKFI